MKNQNSEKNEGKRRKEGVKSRHHTGPSIITNAIRERRGREGREREEEGEEKEKRVGKTLEK